MTQAILQVDAFTDTPFAGNPAGVCVLSESQPDHWMQHIAQEMNLPETAFLLRQTDGFALRWFTPTTEVPLCGHATLASAHVLWTEGYLPLGEVARFHTKSGLLTASLRGDWIELDFPASPSESLSEEPADTLPVVNQLQQALGVSLQSVYQNSLGYLVEVDSERSVRHMQPDLTQIAALPLANVIVTSRTESGSPFDFVSRFFAPGLGIPEDPVTGAAHCCLAPFWRDRLQKDTFLAYQASQRGGVVKVHYDGGSRVFLGGQAVTVFRAELTKMASGWSG